MDWENILKDAVQDGTIRELYLKKVPVLRTCDNWRKVEPVGWVDYRMNLSYYKGGLVKLMGKLYFVHERTFDALSEYIEFKFKKHIQVIKE